MAQEQKQESEVLLVTNEGSDQLEVVSKVDENGALRTVAPAQANEANFFKFDKHSDMMESFLKNYFAQVNNPKHMQRLVSPERLSKSLAHSMRC